MSDDFNVPMLSWSIAAANKQYFAESPLGMVPQIQRSGYASFVWRPEGCVPPERLAKLAPGCGLVFDRALGLHQFEYDIGLYAGGEKGRRAACSPCPLAEDGVVVRGSEFESAIGLYNMRSRFAMLAVFVGSPPQYFPETWPPNENALRRSLLNKCATVGRVLRLLERGVVCIFDTGGVVDDGSDAFAVFRSLARHRVPFLLEPTRPKHDDADATIESSRGLVSLRQVHETMEREVAARTRAWYDDAELEQHGRASVVWYTDADERARVDGALARLAKGGRVLVALRGLTEAMVRELHEANRAALIASGDATKADTTNVRVDVKAAGGHDFTTRKGGGA